MNQSQHPSKSFSLPGTNPINPNAPHRLESQEFNQGIIANSWFNNYPPKSKPSSQNQNNQKALANNQGLQNLNNQLKANYLEIENYEAKLQSLKKGRSRELASLYSQENDLLAQYEREKESENYYSSVLIISFFGILLYYIGSCLLIFFRNIDGVPVVTLNTYSISWQLFFENLPLFISNFLNNVFGYFIEYGRLFGFFEAKGELNIEAVPRYLFPVDLFIKAFTIIYFHFFWMRSDSLWSFEQGLVNNHYPRYQKSKEEIKLEEKELQVDEILTPTSANFSLTTELSKEYSNIQTVASLSQAIGGEEDSDNDGEEEVSIIPFAGVLKPLEEFYRDNEETIYRIIRHRILPSSNLILAFYFSTRSVLSFNNPLGILLYIFGIMSMFWCMQNFLVVLDHNQYPPEEE